MTSAINYIFSVLLYGKSNSGIPICYRIALLSCFIKICNCEPPPQQKPRNKKFNISAHVRYVIDNSVAL